MLQAQTEFMRELEELATWLMNSNLLILKENGALLECQFIWGGLVRHIVHVRNEILTAALKQKSERGIIEGATFNAFKNNFSSFSLHVKARQLYAELSARPTEYVLEFQQLAIAS